MEEEEDEEIYEIFRIGTNEKIREILSNNTYNFSKDSIKDEKLRASLQERFTKPDFGMVGKNFFSHLLLNLCYHIS